MKKRIAPISLALIFSLVILTVQCRFEPPAAGTGKHSNRSIETGFDEEKILTNVSLASSFADNRVLIVLKKSVSMDFRTYTPEDFPEIPGIVRVVDASRRTMAIVQEQLNAQKTGDWSKLRRRMELGMLGDVNRFRRILYLELAVQSKENVLQVIKLLEQREEIWYCGPDYVIEFGTIPNPSPIPHANQIDTFNSISLLEAWDYISTNNIPVDTTVKVGIMDTGVYKYHEALDGQIDEYLSRDFSTGDPDGLGGDPFDDAHRDRVFFGGHGTPIAGILAANGTDVTGIYWYGTVVSLKLQGHNYMSSCEFLSYAINAIDYANDEDVLIPILNFSAVVSGFDIALYTAINQYDGLFVCIANNNGYNNDELPIFPANWTADFDFRKFSYVFPNSQYMPYLPRLSNLISVGALDEFNNGRRDSSNYGATSVDLFAPGTDIWTTYNFSGYGPFDHTSAAAPIVAGVAALVKSIHPNLLGPQLKDILLASVEEVPNLKVNNYCRTGGKINAYNAVTQTPPIGSMEIIFAGIGLGNVGKFFLHPNGTWEIIEKGIYTSPISSFAHNPENVHLSPVPSEITTYMIQNNIDDIS
ncbi:MAG: S8 family serine peptidase, partial [Treponema sp.]|nr:S8 family serine peptidase [Treponema sp.]